MIAEINEIHLVEALKVFGSLSGFLVAYQLNILLIVWFY